MKASFVVVLSLIVLIGITLMASIIGRDESREICSYPLTVEIGDLCAESANISENYDFLRKYAGNHRDELREAYIQLHDSLAGRIVELHNRATDSMLVLQPMDSFDNF